MIHRRGRGGRGGLAEEASSLRVDVGEGGWVEYHESFLPADEADEVFRVLRRGVAWEQFRNHLWVFPRLTAFVADAGVAYRYSGVTHTGSGWPHELSDLRRRVEEVAAASFNGVLLNLYRDGNDSMGRHADAEPELGPSPLVASVSLGAVRTFVLRHRSRGHRRSGGHKRTYELAPGSLLLMGGTLQHFWVHELPKTRDPVGERLNLTFRNFVGRKD
jgi:alkylated DNA repair dioxygenase AlkB